MLWAGVLGWGGIAGCGGATLIVDLEQVAGDAALERVERIEAAVIADEELLEVASIDLTPGATGGQLDLNPVPRRQDVRLLLTGYDGDGVAVAAGTASPRLPELSGTCCVTVCFCTLGLVDAGGCTCGSDDCGACP